MASNVKGLDKLLAQIKALPDTAAVIAAAQLHRNAADTAEAVARAAPKRFGALARSCRAEQTPDNQRLDTAGVKARAGLSFQVIAGDAEAYYARWVEFGTAAAPAGRFRDANGKTRNNHQEHHATPAQPFFYPTIRARAAGDKAAMVKAGTAAAKAVAASASPI